MDWIDLAQNREWWRAVVNAVMKLRVAKKMRGISWLAEELLASQEGLCFMELWFNKLLNVTVSRRRKPITSHVPATPLALAVKIVSERPVLFLALKGKITTRSAYLSLQSTCIRVHDVQVGSLFVWVGIAETCCRRISFRYWWLFVMKLSGWAECSFHAAGRQDSYRHYFSYRREIWPCGPSCNVDRKKGRLDKIIWNANLMQQDNFINIFLARHVSGTYAHHQEH